MILNIAIIKISILLFLIINSMPYHGVIKTISKIVNPGN